MSVNENKENYKVVQSQYLNDAKYEAAYTMLEKKLILSLISKINKFHNSFELIEVPLDELDFIPKHQKNHTYLHNNVCKTIMSKPIEVNGFWCNWFVKLRCENGLIVFKFDEDLKKHILDIEDKYNEFFLSNILNLKKYHSIRIYEILSLMVHWNNSKQVFYRRINWEDFKDYLNIKDGYRNNDIGPKIIEKVQKEIEEKTDLKFNFTIKKKANKYDYIDFVIMKNKKEEEI